MPPEAGGGIRGMAVHGCSQEDPSPAFRPELAEGSASPKSSAVTSSEPVLDLIGESEAAGRSQPLRLGIPEDFSPGCSGDTFLQGVPIDPVPGAVIAMQSFGDFLGLNPPPPHSRDRWLLLWLNG